MTTDSRTASRPLASTGLDHPQRRDGNVPRLLAVVAASGLIAIALLHPAFRHVEGHLSGRFVLPMAGAVALLAAAWCARTSWSRTARWLALAIVGQAAALQLARAGMMIGYQHYARVPELLDRDFLAAVLVGIQAALVAGASARHLGSWLRTTTRMFGAWRLLVVAVAFVLTSATLSKVIADYGSELVLASFLQLIGLANIILAITALPEHAVQAVRPRCDALLGLPNVDTAVKLDRFALVAAAWVLCVCGVLAYFVYQNHPHVPDEIVYLYHARYFARGMMAMPLPPVPAAFDLDLMTYEATRWYSPVPPGWPAALAVGAFFGVPWLVNPALNAIAVLLTYLVVGRIYDRRIARLTLLLFCASPWFLFMGMNFMTHALSLVCALVGSLAVLHLRDGRSIAWTIPGGIALGTMAMIRPLEGLVIAVLLGFWLLGKFPWRRRRLAQAGALAVVSMAMGALTLPYNDYMAGDPTTFPLMAYTDSVYGAGTNALGFGANRGLGWPGLDPFPGHGLIDVAVNANQNFYSINTELLGWAIGSMLPLLLWLLPGVLKRQDWWMLLVIAAIAGVHSFYWFSGGPDFGARYWYLIIVSCLALVARGLFALGDALARVSAGRYDGETRVLIATFALAGITLITFIPWRSVDKYFHYRNMRPDVRTIAKERNFGRSVVLVRGKRHPDYASAANYNPLELTSDAPIYIWDRDPRITRQALQAYADRNAWILDGPTRTGRGFRVVTGPVRAQDLLSGTITIP